MTTRAPEGCTGATRSWPKADRGPRTLDNDELQRDHLRHGTGVTSDLIARQLRPSFHQLVYGRCMGRTNIDIDEDACRDVMERYNLATKREAVNLALRRLAGEPLDLDEARAMRGSGWDGDLAEMRASRVE